MFFISVLRYSPEVLKDVRYEKRVLSFFGSLSFLVEQLLFCDVNIGLVDFKADERYPEFLAGERSRPGAHERVKDKRVFLASMELYAHFREFFREHCGMDSGVLNRFIRDEPGVASSPEVLVCFFPASNIGFILVFHPDCELVNGYVPDFCEMKDIFVAVTEVTCAVDGLIVSNRDVIGDCFIVSDIFFRDSNGFYPVNRILKNVVFTESVCEI